MWFKKKVLQRFWGEMQGTGNNDPTWAARRTGIDQQGTMVTANHGL